MDRVNGHLDLDRKHDSIAALAAFATVTPADVISLTRANPAAAGDLVKRELCRLGDLMDAALAHVDKRSDLVRGADEALVERLNVAEAAAYSRFRAIRKALSLARRMYGITPEEGISLRERVSRERGRNRFDVADLEHAPVRRTRPTVTRARPERRPRSRSHRSPRATRAGPSSDDPDPGERAPGLDHHLQALAARLRAKGGVG